MHQTVRLIRDVVAGIQPHDQLERVHKNDVMAWIDSGTQLFRLAKPDKPPKHLVSYFIVYDPEHDKLLLINHLKSGLLLPTGGHIEPDEGPRVTVEREAAEELGLTANFGTKFGNDPLFITVTVTKGQGQHTDVSLWYVIEGDSKQDYAYEAREMDGYRWLTPTEVLATDIAELDENMHRFVRKMQSFT